MFKSCLYIALLAVPLAAGGLLKFSHKLHTQDEELSCTTCHQPAAVKGAVMPVKFSACADCHEDPVMDSTIKFEQLQPQSIKFKFSPMRFSFDHQKHTSQSCLRCHSDSLTGGKGDYAVMDGCVSCHKQNADPSCNTCHSSPLKPGSHQLSWLNSRSHGLEAGRTRGSCSSCHQQSEFCTSCHMGVNGRQIHRPNYKRTHGIDVKFKTSNCSVCHQPLKLFCADCHERRGVPR